MVDAVVHGHLTDVVVASRKDPQFLTDVVVRGGQRGNFAMVRFALRRLPAECGVLYAMKNAAFSGDVSMLSWLDAWSPGVLATRDAVVSVMESAMLGGSVPVVDWLLPSVEACQIGIWALVLRFVEHPRDPQRASVVMDERMWALASRGLITDLSYGFSRACRNNHLRLAQLMHSSGRVPTLMGNDLRVCVKYAPDVARWLFSLDSNPQVWTDNRRQRLHLSVARMAWMAVVARGYRAFSSREIASH